MLQTQKNRRAGQMLQTQENRAAVDSFVSQSGTHTYIPFGKLKFFVRKDQRLLMQDLKYLTD
jgi:hypothetical protein